jgi:hypothetical protein
MVGYKPEKETQLFASEQALAGAVTGAVSRALSQPLDVLKIRFQVSVHYIHNFFHVLIINKFVFVYSRTSNFSAVTFTVDTAANLDLCLALIGFSCEGSFICHTCCEMGRASIFRGISERPVIIASQCRNPAKDQSLHILTS